MTTLEIILLSLLVFEIVNIILFSFLLFYKDGGLKAIKQILQVIIFFQIILIAVPVILIKHRKERHDLPH